MAGGTGRTLLLWLGGQIGHAFCGWGDRWDTPSVAGGTCRTRLLWLGWTVRIHVVLVIGNHIGSSSSLISGVGSPLDVKKLQQSMYSNSK